MARTGRPKSDNPKNNFIGLAEESAKLRNYASKHDMTISQVLLRGIDMQYELDTISEQ